MRASGADAPICLRLCADSFTQGERAERAIQCQPECKRAQANQFGAAFRLLGAEPDRCEADKMSPAQAARKSLVLLQPPRRKLERAKGLLGRQSGEESTEVLCERARRGVRATGTGGSAARCASGELEFGSTTMEHEAGLLNSWREHLQNWRPLKAPPLGGLIGALSLVLASGLWC